MMKSKKKSIKKMIKKLKSIQANFLNMLCES
jgi:hypothetical protein